MSTSPAPSIARGDITLQPSYFTSSLYVYPLKDDISNLIQAFSEQYLQSDCSQPFSLFKRIWGEQGWEWLHFKVFDGRSREKFIGVTLRLFAERFNDAENPIARVVALFGMYTFFSTQPSTSSPALHSLKHIALPMDIFRSLLTIPSNLMEPDLLPLQPYATHILSKLLDAQVFHILPDSSLQPQNPSNLPREYFIPDGVEPSVVLGLATEGGSSNATPGPSTKPVKKKGRPSKREKAKRAKDAVAALDRWVDKNSFTFSASLPGLPSEFPSTSQSSATGLTGTTHALIAHPPTVTRETYSAKKAELLEILTPPLSSSIGDSALGSSSGAMLELDHHPGREALGRANEAVLARLKKIDEMAAEKGLEVGGEGGDMTGLARVEKAVLELRRGASAGGILNLLDGAGMEEDGDGDITMGGEHVEGGQE